MKKILLYFSIILLLNPVYAHTKINVLKVYDGDTILAKIDNNVFRIRLIDIDCFEGSNCSRAHYQSKKYNMSIPEINKQGNLARDILYKKLKNQNVYFDFRGIDKYHRALGTLYINDVNINKEMLKTPYCMPYTPKYKK